MCASGALNIFMTWYNCNKTPLNWMFFCAISRQKVYGPFSFGEATVIGTSYLDVLQLWLFPQLVEDKPNNFIWQQYGALPHWHNNVLDWLNITVPECWIGHKGPNDIVLHGLYTHRIGHHVISTCGGSIKDRVCVPTLPDNLPDLKNRIKATVAKKLHPKH